MTRLAFVLCAAVLVVTAAGAQTAPVEIKLDHLTLRWSLDDGLVALCDGRTMLGPMTSPVVAYPPGWAWSYHTWGEDKLTAKLTTQGKTKVLTVQCRDPKVDWTQTVTAGPGDRFTVAYACTQKGWETPLNYEICLCAPTVDWFVGSRFTVGSGPTAKTGEIPLKFGGVANPITDATQIVFETLQGKLTVTGTLGLTLFDYAARQKLWLGRDGNFPLGKEQKWSGSFVFEQKPFEVAGLRLDQLQLPDKVNRERLPVSLRLTRLAGGPAQATARLVCDDEKSPAADEKTVALDSKPATIQLSIPLAGAGAHVAHLELLAGDKLLYRTPPFTVRVPQLLSVTPARVPFARGEQGVLLATVDAAAGGNLRVVVNGPAGRLAEVPVKAGTRSDVAVPLDGLPLGFTKLQVALMQDTEQLGSAACDLLLAEPKPTGVAIDNRTHTLVVGGLPFCPQACYADVRTMDQVIETEAPLGINLVSPYLSNDLAERRRNREDMRKFMDRCAALGIYVQLGMLAASRAPQDEAKWAWVKEEVEAFRDHPALLTYYLADEPELGWATPEACEAAYRKIKELDPWHPVTMVFCQAPAAARYRGGMDVCMTDPYPIPNGPVTQVVDFCESIRRDLGDSMPLWVVPQAFGGGEWWRREPSRQEMRVMTYLALIHGARGIQYFIRRPVLGNPSSPELWAECRRLMQELGQLTPALTSAEKAPEVKASLPQVHAAAFRERGAITVLATNVANEPLPLELTLEPVSGQAEVVFENRAVAVKAGKLTDMIDAFGSRVYRLQVDPPPADRATLDRRNLVFNPSFEEAHNTGTPDGSYTGPPADLGASWYVDPRLAAHGRQSLRLRAPVAGQAVNVAPFPINLTPATRYRLSIWARAEQPGQKFSLMLDTAKGEQATHALTTDWQEYAVEFTSSEKAGRSQISLRFLGVGSVWFDALQVVPVG